MANKDFIELLKMEMGFGATMRCGNCANCTSFEKDANSPIEYTCEYASNFHFVVDENDCCRRWEEI